MASNADNPSERPLPDGRGSDETSNVTRSEWLLVAVLVVIGTTLRCWQPGHMAVEHFDEGVYASNLYSPDGAYPYRHLYAPPLLPFLLEWALIVTGGAAGSVMWVNVIAGSLTVPSLWWVGRQWFGPLAGIAAAALCALSQMHILYSRTALTDVLLCLWMLWGVYWAWKAILTGRPAAILLAGLFASLAWWTKYNGWLTLAISGAGTFAWLVTSSLRRRAGDVSPPIASTTSTTPKSNDGKNHTTNRGTDVPRSPVVILRWIAIATLAVVGWLPYLVSLQDHGGYAVVSANHAKYFVGLTGWWEGFLRQWENLSFVASANRSVGLCLLCLGILGTADSGAKLRRKGVRDFCLIGCGAMWIASGGIFPNAGLPIPVLFCLSIVGLLLPLQNRWRKRLEPERLTAYWILVAWCAGLFAAIPLYTTYPRLTLPLALASWTATGLAVQLLSDGLIKHGRLGSRPGGLRSPRRVAMTLTVLVLAGIAARFDVEIPFEDRTGIAVTATSILGQLPDERQTVVTVLGEPALFFHLANQSRDPDLLILPGGDFASLSPPDPAAGPVEMYVVYGPHVMREQDPAAGVSWAEAHLTPVAEWEYRPSTLVLLNEYPPEAIRRGDIHPSVIRLARIGE